MLGYATLAYIRETAMKYGAQRVMLFGSSLILPESEVHDIDLLVRGVDKSCRYEFDSALKLWEGPIPSSVDVLHEEDEIYILPLIAESGLEIYVSPLLHLERCAAVLPKNEVRNRATIFNEIERYESPNLEGCGEKEAAFLEHSSPYLVERALASLRQLARLLVREVCECPRCRISPLEEDDDNNEMAHMIREGEQLGLWPDATVPLMLRRVWDEVECIPPWYRDPRIPEPTLQENIKSLKNIRDCYYALYGITEKQIVVRMEAERVKLAERLERVKDTSVSSA